jgi:hypothetical protein
LHSEIRKVCPILGVSVPTIGTSVGVRIDFDVAANQAQRDAAQNVVDTFDWSQAAHDTWQLATFRTTAVDNSQVTQQQDAMFTRALCLTAMDEFNAHALKINAILDAVDAATSLADLKSRVALISDYPQRTKTQLYNAIVARIQDGTADGSN